MGVKTIVQAAAGAPAAWKRWNGFSHRNGDHNAYQSSLPYDPEYAHPSSPPPLPLSSRYSESLDDHTRSNSGSTITPGRLGYSYGSTDDANAAHSPERLTLDTTAPLHRVAEEADDSRRNNDNNDSDDEDEDEWEAELELELEDQGLYKGSYTRMVVLYTLVPLTTILVLAFFACIPRLGYPIFPTLPPASVYPYLPWLPFPVPEIVAAASLWSLTYLLRSPIHSFMSAAFALVTPNPDHWVSSLLSSLLVSILTVVSRFATLAILLIPRYVAHPHPSPHDPAFRRVWAVALGWAIAEAVVGTKQGYERIALYRNVMVGVSKDGLETNLVENGEIQRTDPSGNHVDLTPSTARRSSSSPNTIRTNTSDSLRSALAPRKSTKPGTLHIALDGSADQAEEPMYSADVITESPIDFKRSDEPPVAARDALRFAADADERAPLLGKASRRRQEEVDDELRALLEDDFEELIALKAREELEELYGMPFIKIPVFISCLQRLNAVLMSLGFFLLLSSAYIHATAYGADLPTAHLVPPRHGASNAFVSDEAQNITPLLITVPVVVFIHLVLSILHTSFVLPRIGVHTAVYIGLLLALGSFFAGLGTWGALS